MVPNEPVVRHVLADHHLPEALLTSHVEVRRIVMQPNVAAGPHEHNGPVFGLIEKGSVIFSVGQGPEVVLRAGDTFYEPAGTRISRFDATEEGAQFIGYFLLTDGQAPDLNFLDAS